MCQLQRKVCRLEWTCVCILIGLWWAQWTQWPYPEPKVGVSGTSQKVGSLTHARGSLGHIIQTFWNTLNCSRKETVFTSRTVWETLGVLVIRHGKGHCSTTEERRVSGWQNPQLPSPSRNDQQHAILANSKLPVLEIYPQRVLPALPRLWFSFPGYAWQPAALCSSAGAPHRSTCAQQRVGLCWHHICPGKEQSPFSLKFTDMHRCSLTCQEMQSTPQGNCAIHCSF